MRNKIYKNREVLRNLPVGVTLCGEDYEFKIIYVNEKVIKMGITLNYSDMLFADSNSLDGIVKKVILETSSNNAPLLARQAFLSKHKLKKVDVVADGIEFKIDTVTNSNLMLAKSIGYHELLNSNDGFFESIRNTVEDNLLENPPKVRKSYSNYSSFGTLPYLFETGGEYMHFTEVGYSRTVVSEEQLEKNREKFKEQSEKEKKNREKMKKLDKELGLDKKSDTRELARFR